VFVVVSFLLILSQPIHQIVSRLVGNIGQQPANQLMVALKFELECFPENIAGKLLLSRWVNRLVDRLVDRLVNRLVDRLVSG
jgi:hypothetical protein